MGLPTARDEGRTHLIRVHSLTTASRCGQRPAPNEPRVCSEITAPGTPSGSHTASARASHSTTERLLGHEGQELHVRARKGQEALGPARDTPDQDEAALKATADAEGCRPVSLGRAQSNSGSESSGEKPLRCRRHRAATSASPARGAAAESDEPSEGDHHQNQESESP